MKQTKCTLLPYLVLHCPTLSYFLVLFAVVFVVMLVTSVLCCHTMIPCPTLSCCVVVLCWPALLSDCVVICPALLSCVVVLFFCNTCLALLWYFAVLLCCGTLLLPRGSQGIFWCLPPIWNLRALSLIPLFNISSFVLFCLVLLLFQSYFFLLLVHSPDFFFPKPPFSKR